MSTRPQVEPSPEPSLSWRYTRPFPEAVTAFADPKHEADKIEYRNYKALVERAAEVFGDELKAARWLSTPSADLEGKVPMQVVQEVHYSAVALENIFEPIFVKIEHGVYW